MGDEFAGEIEIEPVADHVGGADERFFRLGGQPIRIAGAKPDHIEPARRDANAHGIDDAGRAGDGDRGAAGRGFLDNQLATAAHRRQCRRFGDAVTADGAEHGVGGVGQARRLPFKMPGREEPRRHAERFGQLQHRRFIGFEIEREHAGDGLGRQLGLLEHAAGQCRELLRRGVAFASHPERQGRRMIDQLMGAWLRHPIGDAQHQLRALRPPDAAAFQPAPVAGFDAYFGRFAGEQRRRDMLRGLRVGEAIARPAARRARRPV